MSQFVSPTGYVELDNDCNYSIDLKSTRSREEINPKEDLAFYFDTYLVPKYGLNNLNVNNCANFMKDLEMNWTRLDAGLRGKVMDILVDGILSRDTTFKADLLAKLGGSVPAVVQQPSQPVIQGSSGPTNTQPSVSQFGKQQNKSSFGFIDNGYIQIGLGVVVLIVIFFVIEHFKRLKVSSAYPRFGK